MPVVLMFAMEGKDYASAVAVGQRTSPFRITFFPPAQHKWIS